MFSGLRNVEIFVFPVPPSAPSRRVSSEQRFSGAVSLLRGSLANYALCWISMGLSLVAAGSGIALMEEGDGLALVTKQVFAAQSIVFLVAQAFTLAKTSRDCHESFGDLRQAPVTPTGAYMAQVLVSSAIAVMCAIYSLVYLSKLPEWRAFFAMTIVWLWLAASSLAKAVRDRHEAKACKALPVDCRQQRLSHMLATCNGKAGFVLLVWVSAMVSVSFTLGTMWTWSHDIIACEGKGYFSGMVLWSLASACHLAKLVRDRQDPAKLKALQKQATHQLLIVGSSAASVAALVGGASLMPLETRHRLFLLTGTGFTLSAAFFLAKHLRDREEVKTLRALPEDDVYDAGKEVETLRALPEDDVYDAGKGGVTPTSDIHLVFDETL